MKVYFQNIRPECLEKMMNYLQVKVNQDFKAVGAGHIEITNVQQYGLDWQGACRISCELNDCVQTPRGEYPSDLTIQCFTTFFEGTYLELMVPETKFVCCFV
ncbi:MAG: hypothetical protein Q7S34_03740 [bacterium]|nr:hypothetical protein [bacterium]